MEAPSSARNMIFDLLLWLVMGGLFAYAILQPVMAAPKTSPGSTALYLTDFFSLSLLLGGPMVYLSFARTWHDRHLERFYIVAGLLVVLVTLVWWRLAQSLSEIGVTHAGRRMMHLSLLFPLAVAGALIGPPLVIGGFRTGHGELRAVALVMIAVAWAGRASASWVLHQPQESGEEGEERDPFA